MTRGGQVLTDPRATALADKAHAADHPRELIQHGRLARHPETPSGPTPHEHIANVWTCEPERFILDPIHQTPGPTTPRGWLHPSGSLLHADDDIDGVPSLK